MNYFRTALLILVGLHWNIAVAQIGGEASEISPEQLDAAFTSEDAAREAAAFSDNIIAHNAADPLKEMTDVADLVFRGSVKAQSFVYAANGTPYTHTTFAIADILKGQFPESEITLIQEGGPAQDAAEKILMVSGTQYFNVGEEELLFMDLDPDNPVVRDRAKVAERFRIYEGKVYSEDGRGVIIETVDGGSGRRVSQSDDRHPAEQFKQITIGSYTLTKNFGVSAGRPDSAPSAAMAMAQAARVVPKYTDSITVSAFSAAIRN